MKYFGEDDDYIKGECENCGRVLKIKREGTRKNDDIYILNPHIRCYCGKIHEKIEAQNTNLIKCPKCGSSQITTKTRGFSLGYAAIGDILLGPVGLLGGLIGSKKIVIVCLNCGHEWNLKK
jgi:tellurium resistance protein TerD